MHLSKRGTQWTAFSRRTLEHIEEYTVPQYGDLPNDQASQFTLSEIQMNLKRYINRMGSGARGPEETLRDTFKIAHYACLAQALITEETLNDSK